MFISTIHISHVHPPLTTRQLYTAIQVNNMGVLHLMYNGHIYITNYYYPISSLHFYIFGLALTTHGGNKYSLKTVHVTKHICHPEKNRHKTYCLQNSTTKNPVLRVPSCISCSACPILSFLLCLSHYVFPVMFCPFLSYLFCLSRSVFPVLPVLFCLPFLPVLFCLSCCACPFYLSLSYCPVLGYPVLLVQLWTSCSACPDLPVQFCLSCSVCPVLPVLFCLFFYACPALASLTWLSSLTYIYIYIDPKGNANFPFPE